MKLKFRYLVLLIMLLFVCQFAYAETNKTPERTEVANEFKWKPEDMFKNITEFNKEKDSVTKKIIDLKKFQGKIKNASAVKTVFDQYYLIEQKVGRLNFYASLLSDTDLRQGEALGLVDVAQKLSTDLTEASSFIEPEILKLSTATINSMISSPKYKNYNIKLKDILRKKTHILSASEEKILSGAQVMSGVGSNVYDTFTSGEMPFSEITLANGEKTKLSASNYYILRQGQNRDDRKLVFDEFFGTYNKNRNTLAQTLSAQVDANVFYAKTKKYNSAIEAALFSLNVPVNVYEKLISKVNDKLPILERYLQLKRSLLGVSQLNYYDLYAPITPAISGQYSYSEGIKLVGQSLKPLGDKYFEVASKAMQPGNGWIDVYPNLGKWTGAYAGSSGPGDHPFVLLNYTNDYDSVSTLAHEMGHAMNSYLTDLNQPYCKSGATALTAEVTSTFNENLLFEYLLKTETDPQKRIALLGESLESMRVTVFRQAMFSEFEYEIYKAAEKKTPLTADFLSQTYLKIAKKYYGEKNGVVKIDDAYAIEWASVPHFYYNFYVYKYVSGYLTGLVLSDKILNGDTKTRDLYIEKVLKAGGSQYPLDELKAAGADLTNEDIYNRAFEIINNRIAELEKLTKK